MEIPLVLNDILIHYGLRKNRRFTLFRHLLNESGLSDFNVDSNALCRNTEMD